MKSKRSPNFKWIKEHNPLHTLRRLWVEMSNQQRRQTERLDYVLMTLPENMPALPEPRNFLRRRLFGEPPVSQWEFKRRLERIANDPRTKGVILNLRGFAMSLADLQSLRDHITTFRESGKRVFCYAQQYDLATYYVASAADEIIVQPGGNLFIVGLRQEAVFLKDALERVGISVDSIAISPYKGAADFVTRNDISEEGRAQIDWLLDSRFNMIVQGIAVGRGIGEEKVREWIDNAPYLDTFAKGIGMLDAMLYEEEFYKYLGTDDIRTWQEADGQLLLKQRRHSNKYVAVLKIEGLMVPGESDNPPGSPPFPVPVVENGRVGDITVVQQVRGLMQDENAAAVVVFVDSGGGAATAADAMRAALAELSETRPVVIYMNGVAASGGYLVSCPGQVIVAQPGTITGSIGVILAKPVGGELRNMLRINAVEFLRGQNADILSPTKPFSEKQRDWLRESIENTYDQFITQVSRGRDMEKDAVDAVGGGRVWTGEQALTHGLVDELGGFDLALQRARELANLPDETSIALVRGKSKPLPPQVADKLNPAAHWRFFSGNVNYLLDGQPQLLMPMVWRDQL